MDILLTTATITVIATLAAVGVAALPWTERELKQSHDAFDALRHARLSAQLAEVALPGPTGSRAVRSA